MKIKFIDRYHQARYNHLKELYSIDGTLDAYRRPLAYLLALTEDTYKHRDLLYSKDERHILPAGLEAAFQTSTTRRITLLAFNLYANSTAFCDYDENDIDLTGFKSLCTPEHIFNDGLAPYFVEALKMRYPEMFREY